MKRFAFLLLFVLFLLVTATPAGAQCAPLGGLANLQWFANDGTLLQNGALYFFVAQTSTQAPTYSDFQCTQLNVNPLPFAQGARTTVWVPVGNFKLVLCASSTDGPFCSPGNQLFVVDNLQGASSGGGGGGGPNFVGIFTSQTPSPATSGALRLSSADSTCWRNQAGSANLCFSKSSSDILQWAGGSFQLPEIAAPTCGAAGTDCIWADNTQHRIKGTNNGGTSAQYVLSGNDIGTTDQISAVHFGSSQAPFSNTLPSTGQALTWNGTNIVGTTLATEPVVTFNDNSTANCPSNGSVLSTLNACAVRWFWANAHTVTRFRVMLGTSAGCTTHPIYSVEDLTSSTVLTSLTQVNGTQTYDSGAISISTTAGHAFGLGMTTASAGCTTTPDFIQGDMTYQ